MKRCSSSLDSPLALDSYSLQVAFGLVLYGTDGKYEGVQPEIAERVRSCCKTIFNCNGSDSYWEKSFKNFIKSDFRIHSSWKEEYIIVVGNRLVATRTLAESRKVHIENLGKYCDHFPDLEQIRSLLRPLADEIMSDNVDARAQFHLARCFAHRSVVDDSSKLYKLAAKANHAGALYALVDRYSRDDLKKDKANKYLNQVQERGIIYKREEISLDEVKRSQSEYIQKTVDWCYQIYHHWDVSKHGMIYDALDPFKDYLRGKEANPDAQFLLGYCYLHGHGVEDSWDEGKRYLYLAERQHHSLALILISESGFEVNADDTESPELAFGYMKRSAKLGNPVAQGALSDMYLYGIGVDVDPDRALKYAQMSASQGDANGLYRLARCHIWGELEVEKDEKLGLEYLKRAADLGHMDAQYLMSVYYIGQTNFIAAFKYAKNAADQGDVDARAYIHKCFLEGLGTQPNSEMALNYKEVLK